MQISHLRQQSNLNQIKVNCYTKANSLYVHVIQLLIICLSTAQILGAQLLILLSSPQNITVTNEKQPKLEDNWCIPSTMCVNKLADLMNLMSIHPGLPDNQRVTNTIARRPLVQRMTDSNVLDTLQVYLTVHKNSPSLRKYRTSNDSLKNAISSIVSKSSSSEIKKIPYFY